MSLTSKVYSAEKGGYKYLVIQAVEGCTQHSRTSDLEWAVCPAIMPVRTCDEGEQKSARLGGLTQCSDSESLTRMSMA